MDAIFRPRKNPNAGSGGKILRGRRVAAAPSPYARPTPSPPPAAAPPPENPNWLLGFIGPATRTVASGAGKLLSTLFGPDSSPSSSSESSTASSSEDGIDDDICAQGDHNLNQTQSDKCFDEELRPTVEMSETKVAIERLLMQETFSRDECNRLTQIIQSRVVEYPYAEKGKDAGQIELHDQTIGGSFESPGALQAKRLSAVHSYLGNGFDSLSPRLGVYMPDSQNTAVMEAKKWLEEKKSESRSKLDRNERNFTSNPYVLPNVAEGEMGSPVLVAKSYMQARPPWASPSLNNIGLQSPSPIGMNLFKEGTPYLFGGHSFSSSKILKRSSLVDSWDALDGARRVRFKSGEDVPKSDSCNPINSLLELEQKCSPTSSMHDKTEEEVVAIIDYSNSSPHTRSIDAAVVLPTDLAINPVHNGPGNEALSSVPSIHMSNKTPDFEDEQQTGREEFAMSTTHETHVPDNVFKQHDGLPDQPANVVNSEPQLMPLENIKPPLQSDGNILPGVDGICEFGLQKSSQLGEMMQVNSSSQATKSLGMKEMDSANGSRSPGGSSTQEEVNRTRDVLANGFPASGSSLAARLNGELVPRNSDENDPNPLNTRDDKLATGRPVEETCELLSEASVEIPVIEETDSMANGSHDSGRQSKEPFKTQVESVSGHGRVKRVNTRIQKQQENRGGRYSRRSSSSRGRGK